MAKARYVGPPGYRLSDGTNLVPGETIADVPEDQFGPCWESASGSRRQAPEPVVTSTEDDE